MSDLDSQKVVEFLMDSSTYKKGGKVLKRTAEGIKERLGDGSEVATGHQQWRFESGTGFELTLDIGKMGKETRRRLAVVFADGDGIYFSERVAGDRDLRSRVEMSHLEVRGLFANDDGVTVTFGDKEGTYEFAETHSPEGLVRVVSDKVLGNLDDYLSQSS